MEKKLTKRIDIYIDSEWSSNDEFITLQVVTTDSEGKSSLYIYYNNIFDSLKAAINDYSFQSQFPQETIKGEMIVDDLLKRIGFEDQTDVSIQKMKVNLHFYYSIRDLYYLFSETYILAEIQNKKKAFGAEIIQRNFIKGSIQYINEHSSVNFRFCDKYGWVPKGLKQLLDTLSIENKYKDSLNEFKGEMEKYLYTRENAKCFLNYAISDVVSLSKTDHSYQMLLLEHFQELSL